MTHLEQLIKDNTWQDIKGGTAIYPVDDVNRLAEVCRVLVKSLRYYANGGDWVNGEVDSGECAKNALSRAEEVAGGK